jgi:hypothetical protein
MFFSGLKNLKVKICSLKTDTYYEKAKHIFISCEENAGQHRSTKLGCILPECVVQITNLGTTLSNQN